MHDVKERLSLFWIFVLLNYLYADVTALFAVVGARNIWRAAPHISDLGLLGSSVFMEIPIAMIVASRLLPFRANRWANIIAASVLTVVNGAVTFVAPLIPNMGHPPAFGAYLFFGTVETICTVYIVWQAWNWSQVGRSASSEQAVGHAAVGSLTH
jgi:hypothetical protein